MKEPKDATEADIASDEIGSISKQPDQENGSTRNSSRRVHERLRNMTHKRFYGHATNATAQHGRTATQMKQETRAQHKNTVFELTVQTAMTKSSLLGVTWECIQILAGARAVELQTREKRRLVDFKDKTRIARLGKG